MEEPVPIEQPQAEKPRPAAMQPGKGKSVGKLITIILAVLLVASLGVLGWYWTQAEAEKKSLIDQKAQLQSQLDELKAAGEKAEATESEPAAAEPGAAACNDTASATMKENIKAALDSKNTAAFSTYTSNPVNYILAASEFGGNISPDEAASSLEYTHNATGPWDFNLPAATIDDWKAGFYTDHFDDATRYIGKAASGMVVSFDFDCNGKIDKIFVAADDDLLL